MDQLAQPFLREGLLGAAIVALALVIIYMSRKLDKKDELINQLHEKRVVEINQFTASFTGVAKDMVATNKDLINQNAILQKAIDTMAQTFQSFINAFSSSGGKHL